MSAGRTNERNALYIRSLEASSVCDQLYKHLASSINAMEPGLWSPSALKNDKVYNHDLVANQKDSGGTGGLKVLQGGVWRKLKFERRTNASAQVLPKRRLPESRWIQHFIPHGYSSSVGGDGVETSVVDRESGIRTIPGRTPLSHERELGAHKGEDHLDENAEICEQNFAEDEALVE